MKLNSISLSNFGLFEEGSMKFTEPVTYFTGANRRGKSTILKAIGWALTGVAPETGADGRNSESLVRIGQPPSGMCVVLDTDKGEVARRVGDTLKSKVGLDIAKRATLAANGSVNIDRARRLGGASVLMLFRDAEAAPRQASRFGLIGRLAGEPGSRRWPKPRRPAD